MLMKVSTLSLLFLTASNAAFVPAGKLAGLRSSAFFSTKPRSETTTTEEAVAEDLLNQEQFLMDMERELGGATAADDMPVIEADPAYITEARLKFAALADACDELKDQYADEITQLKAKSVWDSFDFSAVHQKTSKTGGGAMGLCYAILSVTAVSTAVASDPTTVTDFLGNIDLDLSLPAVDLSGLQLEKINLDVDLSAVSIAVGELSSKTSDFVTNLDLASQIQNWQSESSIQLAQLQAQMDASTVEIQRSMEEAVAGSQVNLAQAKESLQDAVSSSSLMLGKAEESIKEAMTSSSMTLANAQQELASLGSSWMSAAMDFQETLKPSFGSIVASAQQIQEHASADIKGVQESLAKVNFDSSVLTSAGEDLKAFLRQ